MTALPAVIDGLRRLGLTLIALTVREPGSACRFALKHRCAERVWWRRPGLLGGLALGLTALLYLVFVF